MIDGLTIEGPGLADGFPSYDKKDRTAVHGLETAVELILLQYKLLPCVFYKGNLIAVLDRDLHSIDTGAAEKVLGDLSSFANAESWRQHHWALLNPDPETTCGEYLERRLLEARELGQALYG
jgi:hypothetical protein